VGIDLGVTGDGPVCHDVIAAIARRLGLVMVDEAEGSYS
jgi:hypothetical protein